MEGKKFLSRFLSVACVVEAIAVLLTLLVSADVFYTGLMGLCGVGVIVAFLIVRSM